MTHRDTIIDILALTTGDREDAERLLHLAETQAYAEGFDAGYETARNTNTVIAEMEQECEGWTEPAQETDALSDEALD